MTTISSGTLDTNILLRFLIGGSPEQESLADAAIRGGQCCHVSLLSIAEVVFILEGKDFTRAEIKQSLDTLSSYGNLLFSRQVVNQASNVYAHHFALSFVDCCLAFEAESENAEPLWTFDKKLANQAPQAMLLTASA